MALAANVVEGADGLLSNESALDAASWQVTLPKGCHAEPKTVAANWLYDAADQQRIDANPMMILKPDFENMPAHVWRDLEPCFPGNDWFKAQWRLLPVVAYTRIYDRHHQVDADLQQDFEQFSSWTRQGDLDSGWFFLPFLDTSKAFVVLPKRLKTDAFDGVRVIVQFDVDGGNIATAGRLLYVYQGLSADRSQFQLLIVPLRHPDLPDGDATEHLGVTRESLYESVAAREAYAGRLAPWLETRADTMTPTLTTLDQMVLSVHAQR
ncbi:hypothetical protein C7S18_03390 [Ahniella affigens]|uniref:Uncharacterized protein n=1 Tax=Ahniella affigens TaxID=2021234 RepID=A0A2P1PN79_9GAMM|nr:hypothetical protein [Ahniella affigens]AVP96289.1 hypothetical protein C7S18_03390 [Ahniella affigens]